MTVPVSQLSQVSEGRVSAAKAKRGKAGVWRSLLDAVVYVVLVGSIIFGLPKGLAWGLETNTPMAAITSGSMWPVLKKGDLVFIHGVKSKADIALGDIVVFNNRENNTFTIHRVVKMGKTTLVTQGDGNFTKDSPVSYSDVIGKTVKMFGTEARIPFLGTITMFASSKVQGRR